MKTFYRLCEDGNILDFCEFEDGANIPAFVKEQYQEIDRKIVRIYNGALRFEDETVYADFVIPIEELKEAKIVAMKAERDTIQEEPIEYNGKTFDYNKESLQKLNEAKDALEGTEDKQIWICADNTLTYLTYNDIMAIKLLGKNRSNDAHIQYAKLKYLIESLTTKEEIEAITFDTDTSEIILEV